MSKARSLGSKSAPGTVARARSCKLFFCEKLLRALCSNLRRELDLNFPSLAPLLLLPLQLGALRLLVEEVVGAERSTWSHRI